MHQISAATIGCHGESPADNFTVSHEIGSDAQHFGHSTQRDAKTGDDFIKNYQCAVRARQPDCFIDEFSPLNEQAIVCRQRFEDHRGNFRSKLIEDFFDRSFVIQRRDQSLTSDILRNTGA